MDNLLNRISRLLYKRYLGLRGKLPIKFIDDSTLSIHDISLLIDRHDGGGVQYDARSSFEMAVDRLYAGIADCLTPSLIVDIGSNYGFTAIVFARHFPTAKLVLVEPSPRLHPYIHTNMKENKIAQYRLIGAICSDVCLSTAEFALNPFSSQDNRVHGDISWNKIQVPAVTLDRILSDNPTAGNLFIKIDTQGFETQVFRGGATYLLQHDNWLITTEFAPSWLKSQGNSPRSLLEFLVLNFWVTEKPSRSRFRGDSLGSLFSKSLELDDIDEFISHVTSLNARGLGWCDLIIAPKNASYLAPGLNASRANRGHNHD